MLIIKLQFKDIINENRKPFFKFDEDLLSEALENIDKKLVTRLPNFPDRRIRYEFFLKNIVTNEKINF